VIGMRNFYFRMGYHQKLWKLNLEVINIFFWTKWVFAQKNDFCSQYLLVYFMIMWSPNIFCSIVIMARTSIHVLDQCHIYLFSCHKYFDVIGY
jgi:hypothetical protein